MVIVVKDCSLLSHTVHEPLLCVDASTGIRIPILYVQNLVLVSFTCAVHSTGIPLLPNFRNVRKKTKRLEKNALQSEKN